MQGVRRSTLRPEQQALERPFPEQQHELERLVQEERG